MSANAKEMDQNKRKTHEYTKCRKKKHTQKSAQMCIWFKIEEKRAAWRAILIGLVLLSSKNKWNIAHHNENKDNKMSYDIV